MDEFIKFCMGLAILTIGASVAYLLYKFVRIFDRITKDEER